LRPPAQPVAERDRAARRDQRLVLDVGVPHRAPERCDAFQRDIGLGDLVVRLTTLLVVLIAGAASAETPPPTFTVCSSGCDFSMIQDAVAAAVSGATIEVGPGTYAENVTVNAVTSPKKLKLTIEGAGAGSTTVDGSGASSVFTVVGSKAIVTL